MTILNNKRKGTLFVVSGPSGTGKGTVIKRLLENHKSDVFLSVSATTRPPRNGEIDGAHYHFKSVDEFKSMIDNDGLLEWACFCGNYYGTPKAIVDDKLNSGIDVILEIEVQGAMKIKEKNLGAKFIFILPPSLSELKARIVGRNTETDDVIEKRMKTAKEELLFAEKYDYVIMNDVVDNAVEQFESILNAQRYKTDKNINIIKEVQIS